MPPREVFGWLVVGLAILVAAILLTWTLPAVPAPRAPMCADSAQQVATVKALIEQGIEQAMVKHTANLFSVGISGGFEPEGRAAEGIKNAVRAFFHAQRVVAEWQIVLCK